MTATDTIKAAGDHPGADDQRRIVPAALIASIRELHVQRRANMRMQFSIDNSCRALVRRALGWRVDAPEKDRKSINRQAEHLIGAILTDDPDAVKPEHRTIAVNVTDFCATHAEGKEPFERARKRTEKAMVGFAKQLPVWAWAETVRGFGALGLAVIVGEAGDLSNYANPAKLWKRMGVGLVGTRRQGDPGPNATAEEWIEHGYVKHRRSALWTIGDSMIKQSEGPYRAVYLERLRTEVTKAEAEGLVVVTTNKKTVESWEARDLPTPTLVKKADPAKHRTCGHIHHRAQRYMEKRLLRDLWRAWRDNGKAKV